MKLRASRNIKLQCRTNLVKNDATSIETELYENLHEDPQIRKYATNEKLSLTSGVFTDDSDEVDLKFQVKKSKNNISDIFGEFSDDDSEEFLSDKSNEDQIAKKSRSLSQKRVNNKIILKF